MYQLKRVSAGWSLMMVVLRFPSVMIARYCATSVLLRLVFTQSLCRFISNLLISILKGQEYWASLLWDCCVEHERTNRSSWSSTLDGLKEGFDIAAKRTKSFDPHRSAGQPRKALQVRHISSQLGGFVNVVTVAGALANCYAFNNRDRTPTCSAGYRAHWVECNIPPLHKVRHVFSSPNWIHMLNRIGWNDRGHVLWFLVRKCRLLHSGWVYWDSSAR